MKLSENFSLKELTKSQTAVRKGINNEPGDRGNRKPYSPSGVRPATSERSLW